MDTPETFFYIDPPYVGANQGHYGGYTQEYFDELLEMLSKIKGKFILSSYPNKILTDFIKNNQWKSSNQHPCLSLIQFQIDGGELVLSAYQRSSDANLGLPSDIYHLYLIAKKINLPLRSITLFLVNVHIYKNNKENTTKPLNGESVKFDLNVG
jgi:thymidylate synthase